MRTLVLWCPDWPVFAAIREHGLGDDAAVALADGGAVFACSAMARRDGVTRGLRLREAQLRSPALTVLPYDAALDARAFEPVVRLIEEAVPGVQLVRPGTIAMRARGPVRYYGGEEPAARALLETAATAGVPHARVGVSDGPFAAEQAARGTRDSAIGIVPPEASAAFLAPLPVRLVVDPRTATLLNRLGVRTLGEFAALPVADVRRRFGAAGAFAHDLAAGREATRVDPRTPPPDFAVEQEFEPPLDRIDQLAFAFRVRADEFIDRMRATRLVCTAIRVDLDDERGGHSSREWLHPRWFTAADVIDRVRWQLQGAGSAEAGLASPIVRVRVVPARVDSTGNHEDGLWGGGPDERVHHGLTRVQSMLGHEAVATPAVVGGRLLADRQVLIPWGDPAPAPVAAPWPGSLPALAPASVFRERPPVTLVDEAGAPVSIDARGNLPAPPARFSAGAASAGAASAGAASAGAASAGAAPRPVRAWAGPWPVVERWWDAERARRVHRFQIVDADGCAWLLVRDDDGWQAEARYD